MSVKRSYKSEVLAKLQFNKRQNGKRLGVKPMFNKTEVNEIRLAYIEDDVTVSELAEEYETSVPTILCILHGRGAYKYPEDARFK